MTLKPEETSGRYKVTSFIAIQLNHEYNSMCQRKKHSLFHWNYIDVTWSTHTDLDVLQEKKIDDCWNVDSKKQLSRLLKRIHEVHVIVRSHFGPWAFSVQVNIVAVSDHVFHRFPFDLLIHVSVTQLSLFFVSILFSWLPTAQCTLPYLVRRRHCLQILILLTVLLLTLREQVADPAHGKMKSMRWPRNLPKCRFSCKAFPESKVASKRFPRQCPLLRPRLQVLSKWWVASQPALLPWKQVQLPPQMVLTRRSWPSLEQVDGSTATGFHGPGSSDDSRNTRRRLDTFSNPDDENARSAVLLQFPCEQFHADVSSWLKKFLPTTDIPASNRLIRIHCKTGSLSARLAFEIRAKCQDFVARKRMMWNTSATIMFRQSKSPEDWEIWGRFAPL